MKGAYTKCGGNVLPNTPKVLIVEDDPGIRTLLTAALRREPLEIEVAIDGADALRKARLTAYSVILLDLMMPRMTGPEFLVAFREARPQADPIIIVMTAGDDSQIVRLGPKAVHGVIRKPFDIQRLVEMVRDCAQMKGLEASRYESLSIDTGEVDRTHPDDDRLLDPENPN